MSFSETTNKIAYGNTSGNLLIIFCSSSYNILYRLHLLDILTFSSFDDHALDCNTVNEIVFEYIIDFYQDLYTIFNGFS